MDPTSEVKCDLKSKPRNPNFEIRTVQDHPVPTPEEIFRKYAVRIYNIARRILSIPADAEDVTQEVFLQVLRKLPTCRGEASFPTWLYRVTVNAALARRRKTQIRERHRIYKPLEDFTEDGRHVSAVRRWTPSAEQAAMDREIHELIENAIAQLPNAYRDVVVMADMEDLPRAEVAQVLGLSVPAVKSRLHRARLLLRKSLAPHFEELAA
jgi:RNA polymerase sigma-70 factor (ECF subfamily)